MRRTFRTLAFMVLLAALLAPSAALATQFKVYYSEPIGAGEKVYHITSCSKAPAWEPLKCIKKSETEAYFETDQCVLDGKAKDGVPVKGCIVEGEELTVGDASYPMINKTKYKQKAPDGCSDAPEKQGFDHAPLYGIVHKKNPDDQTQWEIKGTLAWPLGQTPDKEYIKKTFNGGKEDPKLVPEKIYKSALCVTYDIPVAKGPEGAGEPVGELEGRVKQLFSDVQPIGSDLILAGCNNDNSAESTIFSSGVFARCSIVERITGESGSDIFGKYISALYRWAAGIVGIVAVLTMVYSGIQISMAGGDTAKLDSAKHRIMQSIIGLAILFLSGLILYTINPTFFTG